MVGPPRRATHAAAAEAGPACARPTPAHEAPAAQPAYWLAQRAAPADLASRPRTAPRAPPAVGQRLLDARCMLLLLPPPPPRIPSSGREPPRASKTRDWLRPPLKSSYGSVSFIQLYQQRTRPPFQHTEYLPTHASTCIASVAPPTACDRVCRSLIACLASRPSISTKNIPTPFDTLSAVARHDFSRLSCTRLPPYGHIYGVRTS